MNYLEELKKLARDSENQLTIDSVFAFFDAQENKVEIDDELVFDLIDELKKSGVSIIEEEITDTVDESFEEEYQGDDSFKRFLCDIGKFPLLTREDEIELNKKIRAGDFVARQHFINCNCRLVVSVSKRYIGLGLPLQDLVQEGCIGLMTAVEKFDYTKGYKFSTYATWWIRQAVLRSVHTSSRSIRLPVHFEEMKAKIEKFQKQYEMAHGVLPSEEEIIKNTGVTKAQYKQYLLSPLDPVSLQTPIDNDGDSDMTIGDNISTGVDIEKEVIDKALVDELLARYESKSVKGKDREIEIILKRFGLRGYKEQTLDQIGKEMGLTRERVRQIQDRILRKLFLLSSTPIRVTNSEKNYNIRKNHEKARGLGYSCYEELTLYEDVLAGRFINDSDELFASPFIKTKIEADALIKKYNLEGQLNWAKRFSSTERLVKLYNSNFEIRKILIEEYNNMIKQLVDNRTDKFLSKFDFVKETLKEIDYALDYLYNKIMNLSKSQCNNYQTEIKEIKQKQKVKK